MNTDPRDVKSENLRTLSSPDKNLRSSRSQRRQETSTSSSDDSDTESDTESDSKLDHGHRRNPHQSTPKLYTFHGDSRKWKVFVFQFKEIARASRWNNKIKFEKLLSSLRENAIEFVFKRPKAERRDYHALVKTLKRRYGQTDSAASYRKSLSLIKQTDDEDLDTFSERVEELITYGFPNLEGSAIDELAIDYFLKAVEISPQHSWS